MYTCIGTAAAHHTCLLIPYQLQMHDLRRAIATYHNMQGCVATLRQTVQRETQRPTVNAHTYYIVRRPARAERQRPVDRLCMDYQIVVYKRQ